MILYNYKYIYKNVNKFVALRIYFIDRSWHGGYAHEDYSA